MERENQRQVIENYIRAYNAFDVESMMRHMHPEVVFENVNNDAVNMRLEGYEAFRAQAKQSVSLFSSRSQRILGYFYQEDDVKIEVDYQGVLAVDFPNGLKAGETIALKGQSIFRFYDDRIILIRDIS